VRGSQGLAYLRGQQYVTPDIVKTIARSVLAHRLIIRLQAAALGQSVTNILEEILEKIPPPV
jgi:MoxR-like ATPase